MNILWNSALSVLDLSSSLIYYLLGRDLDDNDLALIEELFHHLSNTNVSNPEILSSNVAINKILLIDSNRSRINSKSSSENLNKKIDLDNLIQLYKTLSNQEEDAAEDFITKIQSLSKGEK